MPTASREDPLTGFTFAIEIDGISLAYFQECGGLESENEVVEHKAVDKSGKEVYIKLPGRLKFGNVSLKRGVTSDLQMWDWRKKVEEGDMKGARKTGSIVLYNTEFKEVARFNFENGWPSKISGSGLKASGNEVAIEEITIVHEGMVRTK
jgi:phage tail-like protein